MASKKDKKLGGFFSTKQSSKPNDTDITNKIKQALDMSVLSILNNIDKNLTNLLKSVMSLDKTSKIGKSSKEKKKEEKTEDNKESKKVSEEEIKAEEERQKKIQKNQSKVAKKIKRQEKLASLESKIKDHTLKTLKNTSKLVKSSVIKGAKAPIDNMVNTASKVLSSNSLTVDSNLRDMQIGMGLSGTQAMSLSGAMSKLNIDKEDLAFLTEAQRSSLNQLSGTLEKAYSSTDMKAIADMGNSLFKINALISVLKDVLMVKMQEILTVLQPVLNIVEGAITQLIDAVIGITSSEEFKSAIIMLGEIVKMLVGTLEPILNTVLGVLIEVVSGLLTMIVPLLQAILPILTVLINFILGLLAPLMPLINMVIDVIITVLNALYPLISALLPIISTALNMSMDILKSYMPIIQWFLNLVVKVLNTILPPLYKIVATIVNFLIDIKNAIVFWGSKTQHMNVELNLTNNLPSANAIPKSYTKSNNVNTIKNDTKNIKVDATFNSSISGEASNYAHELQKTNYTSSTLLSKVIEQGA